MKFIFGLIFILQLVSAQEIKYKKVSYNDGKHVYTKVTGDATGTETFTVTDLKGKLGYYFQTGENENCTDHSGKDIISYDLNKCITDNGIYFKISRVQNDIVKTFYSDNKCETVKNNTSTQKIEQKSYECEEEDDDDENECVENTRAYCKSPDTGVVYVKKVSTVDGKYEYEVAKENNYEGKEIFTENDVKDKFGYYFKTGIAGDCSDHAQANIISYKLDTCIKEGNEFFKYTRKGYVVTKTSYNEGCTTPTGEPEINNCNECATKKKTYCKAPTEITYSLKTSESNEIKFVYTKVTGPVLEQYTKQELKEKLGYYFKTGTASDCKDHTEKDIFSYKINTCITENGKHFKISRIQNDIVKSYYSDNKCEKVQIKQEVNKTQSVDQESYTCEVCSSTTQAYCKSDYTGVVYVLKKDSTNETTIYEYIVAKENNYEGKQIFTEEELKEDLGYYFKTGKSENCTDQDSSDIVTYKLDTCIVDNGTYFKYTKNDTYVTKTLYSDACKTQTGQPETYNCNKCETNKKTNITTNTYCNVWKPSSSSSAPSGPEGPCDSDFGCDGYVEFKEENKDGFRVFGRLGICYENDVKYIYNVTQKKIAKCDCNKTKCNPVDLKKYENEYELNEGKVFVRRGGYNSSIPCGEQQYQKVYLITGNNNCIKFENVTGFFRYTVSGEKGKETIIEKKASKEDCSDGDSESIYCYKCFKKYTDIPPVKAYCPADQPKISGSSSILIVVMISLLLFFF